MFYIEYLMNDKTWRRWSETSYPTLGSARVALNESRIRTLCRIVDSKGKTYFYG